MIYCTYGVIFHLPGIWESAITQLQTGIQDLPTGGSAIIDAFMNVNETKMYSDWGIGFLIWHSAYFSVCVWISIFLMQAPRPQEIPKKQNAKRKLIALITVITLTIITLLTLIILPPLYQPVLS
ncbi:MAG: hypothetical protein KGD64_15515 [Candidatus Heimdallarchaeota archaeon]|nr:hypothetical protein [Candidatus Heimdallarchaeota archaeon]